MRLPPPTAAASAGIQWGKGQLWTLAGSLVYSPAKDLDIGLKMQYANLTNKLQNAAGLADLSGLKVNNVTTKLSVERTF